MSNTEKIRVGITQGDINGIGYEIIIKTFLDNRMFDICTPIIYGSSKIGAYHRKALDINNFSFNNIKRPDEANNKRVNIINCNDENTRVELGKSSDIAGEAAYLALEAASNDLQYGKIDVLVTAPINKNNIQSEKFNFPGHTEYLGQKFNGKPIMLMVSENLRIAVATGHIPVSEISKKITKNLILEKIRLLNTSMLYDFGIKKPKIAILGLNPHASDEGVIGQEEQTTIIPAINEAKDEGIVAIGPFPADGFFGSDTFKKFDVILAMYHDQGLIPFKTLAFEKGVNYTAGLTVVRTSPGHGTAFEIAGENTASPDSFREAIFLACDILKNRNAQKELEKNVLQKNKKNYTNNAVENDTSVEDLKELEDK